MSPLKRALLALSRFSPRSRTAMIVALDLVLCTFAALLAFSLRIGEWRIFTAAARALILITCVSWLAVAPLRRVYRSVLRFSGTQTIRELAKTCALLSIPLAAFLVFIPINNRIPRTLTLLVPVILFLLLAAARSILSSLLRETLYLRRRTGRRHVLIYGAGVAGRELTGSINDDPEFQVVGFVDDNPVLRGRSLEGYTIWHSTQLAEVLRPVRRREYSVSRRRDERIDRAAASSKKRISGTRSVRVLGIRLFTGTRMRTKANGTAMSAQLLASSRIV
jgi:FlaA1/EpsC-like NDP-sugar epimerase